MVQMEINPGRSLFHVFDPKIENGAGYIHEGDADSSGACHVGVGDVGVGDFGVGDDGDVAAAVEDGDVDGDEREIGWNLEGTIFRSGDSSADDLT